MQTTAALAKKYISAPFGRIDWQSLADHLWDRLLILIGLTLLFILINWLGKRIIRHSFRTYLNRDLNQAGQNRAKTVFTLTTNIFRYMIMFLWIYSVLATLAVPVGTLLAGAGIFSLALGLGAQGFVSDIVTGFFLLLEQQFDVGDIVKINDVEGTITAVGLRTTQITSYDGTLNFIPNRTIQAVANLSRNNREVLIQLRIDATIPIDQMTTIIEKVNEKIVPTLTSITSGPTISGVVTMPDGTLAFQVIAFAKNGSQQTVKSELLSQYLSALQAAGIILPIMPPLSGSNQK